MLTLPWEIWDDSLCYQRSTYMYILMNNLIATNSTGSNCLINHQTCVQLRHLCTTCSIYLLPEHTKISDVDELRWRIKNEWIVWIAQYFCNGRAVLSALAELLVQDSNIGDIPASQTTLNSQSRSSIITQPNQSYMTSSKIIKRVLSHIIFTSYARNVRLQHKCKHVPTIDNFLIAYPV